MPSNSKYERKPKTNVFHIRIGNNIDKIDLKDPAFLKLLEQQYATKYLESLGVESTPKNIYKILKEYPIENCQVLQSRLNGGLYTDTITIIPKSASEINDNLNNDKQQVSNEMIQMLDLKRMGDKKYRSQKVNTNSTQNNLANRSDDVLDDSMLGINSLQPQTTSKKGGTNGSNFRVKGNTNARTNSNAFLMEKSGSAVGQKSSANLFTNYDDMGFAKIKVQKPEADTEQASEGLKFLSFNIQDIKSRYIFPFNDNFKRKSNYKLQDNSNLIEPEDPRIVYEWNVFHFPFTQVKLSLNTLKELQNPIDAKMSNISSFLDSFYQEFPSHIFPLAPDPPKHSNSSLTQTNLNSTLMNQQLNMNSGVKPSQNSSGKSKTAAKTSQSFGKQALQTTMLFTKQQVDMLFSTLRSESMVKFIGVFLHLAYWCIFGGVNPIQIESAMKKKMYIMMFETVEYFKIKVDNKKLWAILVFPMVLLTLKMAAHYFFSLQYTKIFQSEETKKLGIDELALDKIMYLVEKMFDQSNINGRFIFLESEITGAKGTFLKDKEFIRNRIFGTSPGLQIILPNPKNGKARAIMAKNSSAEKLGSLDNGKISQIRSTVGGTNSEGKECQEKLLSLALHKINNRLEEIQGHSSQNNPIINLKV